MTNLGSHAHGLVYFSRIACTEGLPCADSFACSNVSLDAIPNYCDVTRQFNATGQMRLIHVPGDPAFSTCFASIGASQITEGHCIEKHQSDVDFMRVSDMLREHTAAAMANGDRFPIVPPDHLLFK